jgi:hypothetical protein
MAPPSEVTKLEGSQGFVEYTGADKLKDKKVLITGGEYVYNLVDFPTYANIKKLRHWSVSLGFDGQRRRRY